eukprot:GEMP01013858.1.p1 GENE.GEMP01013858.1~~GEMP01013858.1.p1  ORF type:complete len:709 (+),score=181.88 GEMP01013858.1:74-2200(+)
MPDSYIVVAGQTLTFFVVVITHIFIFLLFLWGLLVILFNYIMQLRDYQLRIVNKIAGKNALVVLPTGSGKTHIFAELIRRALSTSSLARGKRSASPHPTSEEGRKVLFLVPTQLLVKQQAEAFRAFTPNLTVGEYMGRLRLPSTFDVLVSTPKSFQTAQKKGEASLAWGNFCLIGFDEVHHVLKDHPYRKIALKLPRSGPKVVGLTASLTYAVEAKKVEAAVKQTIREMRVEVMETATAQELHASGYHATKAVTEVIDEIDIMEEVESSEESEAGPPGGTNRPVPESERKPHLMQGIFWTRQTKKQGTPFATLTVQIVQYLETRVAAVDPGFSSPAVAKSKVKMAEWASYVQKRKKTCKKKDSVYYYDALQAWYDALRISIVSWEEDEELPVIWLRMTEQLPCMAAGETKIKPRDDAPLAHLFDQFNQRYNAKQFRRCATLERVLLERAKQVKTGALRGIVFVQQRLTAHILDYFVRSSPKLAEAGFVSAPLYAVGTPASADFSISKTDSSRTVLAFREGRVNLLVSTVVAEEGMDVPEANCVVRFDPVLNAVSFVQGRGRARQEGAQQVVMRERVDRPVSVLENVEEQQQRIISGFTRCPPPSEGDGKKERDAQRSREVGAAPYLVGMSVNLENAWSSLNLFVKKTKVVLEEDMTKNGTGWSCTLRYESCLRKVEANGSGGDKKVAKRLAAMKLVNNIVAQVGRAGA